MDAPKQISVPLLDVDKEDSTSNDSVYEASSVSVDNKINPFLTRTMEKEFILYSIIKWALGLLVLLPIRVVLTLLIFGLVMPFMLLSTCCSDDESDQPPAAWRRFFAWFPPKLTRVLLFVWGYYWIKTTGEPVLDTRRAPIIVCNHVSLLDGAILFYTYGGALISRIENASIPVVGTMLKATKAILVDRQDANSRGGAQKAIVDRAKQAHSNELFKPIMIFPEGTTTNGYAMIGFKKGGFVPGLPVQPVCLLYTNKYCDVSWPPYNESAGGVLFGVFRQFINFAEVVYLPPYVPDAQEIADPQLFANNVRKKMSLVSGIPITDHSFDDFRLMIEAKRHYMPETSLSGFQLSLLNNINVQDTRNILREFASSNISKSGELNIDEFATMLKLPVTEEVKQLFSLMDTNEDGVISFREYILGFASLGDQMSQSDAIIKYSFQIFDINGNGTVDKSEFTAILRTRFPGIAEEVIDRLWQSVDKTGTGAITYDQFSEFAKNNPQYMKIAEHMIKKKKEKGTIPLDKAHIVESV